MDEDLGSGAGQDRHLRHHHGVHTLPAWAAEDLAELLSGGARGNTADQHPYPHPAVITAEDYASIPQALRSLVGAVVEAPTLRSRPDDILPWRTTSRAGSEAAPSPSPAAAQALTTCHWPENTRQLRRIVCDAASRTDVVDLRHLPGEVFVGTPHRLSRIQALERDEIIRCLTEPATTVAQAADALGMSRATIYRKIAQYDITLPPYPLTRDDPSLVRRSERITAPELAGTGCAVRSATITDTTAPQRGPSRNRSSRSARRRTAGPC